MRNFALVLGFLVALAVGSLAQFTSSPQPLPRCEKFWTEYDGSCYQLSHGGFMRGAFGGAVFAVDGLSQRAANSFCRREKPSATLVTVNSPMENDFLYEWTLRSNMEPQPVWIGLYVNPMTRSWEWFSGEPVNYTNWDELMVWPEPGTGALLFDADPRLQLQNAVDVSARWVPEQILGENHYFICEYRLPFAFATDFPYTTAFPNVTRPPMMLENKPEPQPQRRSGQFQPVNLKSLLGSPGMAGERLHELPRRQRAQRPSAYRQGRFFAAFP